MDTQIQSADDGIIELTEIVQDESLATQKMLSAQTRALKEAQEEAEEKFAAEQAKHAEEIAALQHALDALRTQNEALAERMDEKNTAWEKELKAQEERLSARADDANSLAREAKGAAENTHQSLESVQKLEEELNVLQTWAESMQGYLQGQEKAQKNVQEELAKRTVEIQEFTVKQHTLQHQYNTLNERCEQQEKIIEAQAKELATLQEQNNAANERIAEQIAEQNSPENQPVAQSFFDEKMTVWQTQADALFTHIHALYAKQELLGESASKNEEVQALAATQQKNFEELQELVLGEQEAQQNALREVVQKVDALLPHFSEEKMQEEAQKQAEAQNAVAAERAAELEALRVSIAEKQRESEAAQSAQNSQIAALFAHQKDLSSAVGAQQEALQEQASHFSDIFAQQTAVQILMTGMKDKLGALHAAGEDCVRRLNEADAREEEKAALAASAQAELQEKLQAAMRAEMQTELQLLQTAQETTQDAMQSAVQNVVQEFDARFSGQIADMQAQQEAAHTALETLTARLSASEEQLNARVQESLAVHVETLAGLKLAQMERESDDALMQQGLCGLRLASSELAAQLQAEQSTVAELAAEITGLAAQTAALAEAQAQGFAGQAACTEALDVQEAFLQSVQESLQALSEECRDAKLPETMPQAWRSEVMQDAQIAWQADMQSAMQGVLQNSVQPAIQDAVQENLATVQAEMSAVANALQSEIRTVTGALQSELATTKEALQTGFATVTDAWQTELATAVGTVEAELATATNAVETELATATGAWQSELTTVADAWQENLQHAASQAQAQYEAAITNVVQQQQEAQAVAEAALRAEWQAAHNALAAAGQDSVRRCAAQCAEMQSTLPDVQGLSERIAEMQEAQSALAKQLGKSTIFFATMQENFAKAQEQTGAKLQALANRSAGLQDACKISVQKADIAVRAVADAQKVQSEEQNNLDARLTAQFDAKLSARFAAVTEELQRVSEALAQYSERAESLKDLAGTNKEELVQAVKDAVLPALRDVTAETTIRILKEEIAAIMAE